MLRRALTRAAGSLRQRHPWRTCAARQSSSSSPSAASATVNKVILRSLKDHYLEVSKMTPPPKISPPSPFTVVKGALDSGGPVLTRTHGNEEISVRVMRLANIIPGGDEGNDDDGDDGINQLFVHVDISKPGQKESLHFFCGLYPDALGIHSVTLRAKEDIGFLEASNKYGGPTFQDLDEGTRDALHAYIEERGISESLFPFLQAWLYVKDHRNLMRWFKTIGTFVDEGKTASSVTA
ncbi:unnamed protein product [Cuscuta campestris]|uniref:Mitochondrial glycoprotein n=1 Tax=Cuscuta campestris TaxID=132261 RepID=A0A484KL92_9ASTE|nr:unnamed protein product [Cuscuta campestris]